MRYKVSGAIAVPKASWGCAPALPNRIQVVFPRALFHMKYYKVTLRENGLQRPAKGGSTPAFAYQRAAIAPLPCPNLQPYCFMIQLYFNWTVLKNAIAAGKTCYKNNLLRKRGLLAHTSAAFLKNCCTEKRFICASHKPFTLLFPYLYAIMKQISERSICLCIAYSSPSPP